MKVGLPISFALHALVLSGITFYGATTPTLEDTRIIPIELLTLADISNVRAKVATPEPIPEPTLEPMTVEEPVDAAAEEAPEVVVAPDEPVEKQAEAVLPDAEIVEDPVPEPLEVEKPEPEKPAFSLDDMAALVDKTRSSAPDKNQQKALVSETANIDYAAQSREGVGAGDGETVDLKTAVAAAMEKCWRMPADAVDPENLLVRIKVRLLPGGQVESAAQIDKSETRRLSPGNPYWPQAEAAAIRAVQKCAPYDFLDEERYGIWRDLTLNLRPQL